MHNFTNQWNLSERELELIRMNANHAIWTIGGLKCKDLKEYKQFYSYYWAYSLASYFEELKQDKK